MTRKVELADEADFIARYLSGENLKKLAEQLGVSRPTLGRILRDAGVQVRDRCAAMRLRWVGIKRDGATREILGPAWAAADARNSDVERKALSLYRGGLLSQAAIARRLGLAKPTVGGILRRNGLLDVRRSERRAHGNAGGFNRAMQCAVEPALADWLTGRGMDYVHQHAIGARNVDFGFAAERVAVEIVRRHWNDAKSLRRERLEEIAGAGWRLFVIYDPGKRGIDVARCGEQLAAFLEFVRAHPSAPGQYGMICGNGEHAPAARLQLDHLARIEGF